MPGTTYPRSRTLRLSQKVNPQTGPLHPPRTDDKHPIYTEENDLAKAGKIDRLVMHGAFQICMQQSACKNCPLNKTCPL